MLNVIVTSLDVCS